LNRCRLGVLGEFNVLEQERVQRWAGEGQDRFRNLVTRGFDRDVVILFKVDSSTLTLLVFRPEQLSLETRVAGSRNLGSVLKSSNISIKARIA
jgi:hypothetical protein